MRFVFGFMLFEAGAFFGFFVAALLNAARAGQEITIKFEEEDKYLKMHQQISEWTYTHFPDKEYGEWYGYLHRDGTVAQPAKGNLFKGPFHIPRMMTKGYMLCEEIMSEIKKEIR